MLSWLYALDSLRDLHSLTEVSIPGIMLTAGYTAMAEYCRLGVHILALLLPLSLRLLEINSLTQWSGYERLGQDIWEEKLGLGFVGLLHSTVCEELCAVRFLGRASSAPTYLGRVEELGWRVKESFDGGKQCLELARAP
jgi:hypothetical protein